MTKTFADIIDGIRKAVLGVEVREDIAQGMEYVEQFAATATQKAEEAASSAEKAAQAKQDTEDAKDTAVSEINTAKSEATAEIEAARKNAADNIDSEKSSALTAIGKAKETGLNALDEKQQAALDSVAEAVSTAQSAAKTATSQSAEATKQAAAAASSASAAAASQTAAKASETESAKNLQGTKEYFEQVRTITIGAQGWYATPEALKAAVPVGENGWWAVVGTTDTIWTWDGDTGAWVDTRKEVDLSDYLTQDQIRKLLEQYMPLRPATATTLGGVKVGSGLTVDADGTLSADSALAAYPVGSIYQSTDAASPAALFGGTWEQIAENRVLMGASTTHAAGSTAEAGLPNITGSMVEGSKDQGPFRTEGYLVCEGAFSGVEKSNSYTGHARVTGKNYDLYFDASASNAVYGASDTVQPPAYYVYIWRRVA